MSELEFERRKRRQYPSILPVEREFDDSLKKEIEKERQSRLLREILYSNESAERLAVKACIAGLISFVHYEELLYSSYWRHKKGFFGRTTNEEWTTKKIRRLMLER